jgi:hypothetical protein
MTLQRHNQPFHVHRISELSWASHPDRTQPIHYIVSSLSIWIQNIIISQPCTFMPTTRNSDRQRKLHHPSKGRQSYDYSRSTDKSEFQVF